MTSAKTGNYRKIALASVTGAIGLLYIGIFAGVDVSPTPAGFGTDIPAMTPKEIAATKKKPVYRRGPEVVALNQYFKSIGYSFWQHDRSSARLYQARSKGTWRAGHRSKSARNCSLRIMLPLAHASE
jgi:hypothetical protein